MREWLTRAGLLRDELRGEVAIVTGGGRGIGRAAVRALALLGARVAVAELSDEGAETERLVRAEGGEALFVRTDVSSPDDVARLVETVQLRWGPATILINNAICCPVARVEKLDPDLWDRVMAVNLRADQFLRLSLHPAYPGPMPAEHAGVATAYLVARLAGECHGESVTGYAVLEQAGLLTVLPQAAAHDGDPAPGSPSAGPTAVEPTSPDVASPAAGREEALRLCARLEAMLAETAADFERLPFFVRPLARSGFKAKAGQSLPDWQRTAARLRNQLERGEPVAVAALRPLLGQLIDYVRGVPAQAARFTRDEALLRQVGEKMAGYEADLRALIRAIDQFATQTSCKPTAPGVS